MADYDSSLPIRTEAAGDVDIFISDSVTPANKLLINADGSIDVNATFPAGSKIIITDGTEDLAINADGSINAVVSATDLDIRDLSAAQDNVAISDGTDTLAINADGSLNAIVTATDLDIRNLSSAQDSVEVLQATHDNLNVNANLQVGDADVDATNPVPVVMTSDQQGDEVCDYQTSASVAKNASVNHDYTVTAGKTLLGEQVWVSGSGKLKVEVLVNAVSKWVGFNSTANPNIEIPLKKLCKANAGEVVRITITNRDNSQDVYSTLTGLEV